MPTITTNDGAELYYEDTGTGKPLVMLHGWGCSTAFFQRNVALRGHGESAKVEYSHRISRYAAV